MPSSIFIADLPDAGAAELNDLLALQRQVLGTWNDYQTDVGRYLGPVEYAVFEDVAGTISGNIAASGDYLVLLGAVLLMDGGGTPGVTIDAQVLQVVSPGTYFHVFTYLGDAAAVNIQPNDDPTTTSYSEVGDDLSVTGVPSVPIDFNYRIMVWYVRVEPI